MTLRLKIHFHNSAFQHDGLSGEIAAQAAAAIMKQTRGNLAAMSAAELRGYVRAWAYPLIRDMVDQHLVRRQLTSDQASSVLAASLEKTAHLVSNNLQSSPVVAIPSPHIPHRSAA